jgi:hypothetical protein
VPTTRRHPQPRTMTTSCRRTSPTSRRPTGGHCDRGANSTSATARRTGRRVRLRLSGTEGGRPLERVQLDQLLSLTASRCACATSRATSASRLTTTRIASKPIVLGVRSPAPQTAFVLMSASSSSDRLRIGRPRATALAWMPTARQSQGPRAVPPTHWALGPLPTHFHAAP